MVVEKARCGGRVASIAALLLLAGVCRAQSTVPVFRCVDEAGAVSLQDRPCPPRHASSLREVPRESDEPARPVPLPSRMEPAAEVAPGETAPAGLQPPPPEIWECVDFDGSSRESGDGRPRGRYVPLWVVGRDPDAPAQLFGRIGAPLPRPSITPGGGPRTTHATRGDAQPMVYVEERCHLLSIAARCARLREQRRDIERRRFNAQPTERAELGRLSDALRVTLAESCSG